MKKNICISLVFVGISVLFGLCYYLSFRNALLHYNRTAVEQNNELLQEILLTSDKNELLLQQMIKEKEETVRTSTSQEKLRESASYFLEICYLNGQKEERKQLALPGFMVGIDFQDLNTYINGYMESMPINEYLKGLISFEILSFSEDKVVLRKTYDEAKVENQFYICRKSDYIVIYYSDLKTVYEYTQIRVDDLPDEIRQAIEQGFYVKDAKELYSILEGYTS